MTVVVAHLNSSATRVDALSAPQVLALPALVPVWPLGAAAAGGISRPSVYKLAREDKFVVPVVTIQGKYYCRRSDLLIFLGLTENSNGSTGATAEPLAETSSSTSANQ